MTAQSRYSYSPLSANATRLVTILPGDFGARVACTIEETDLGEPPSYSALSYVWGAASDRREIDIDGKILHITSNLHTALNYLRGDRHSQRLWIDAICINQHDIAERGAQVSMMQSIYGLASEVLIWLGPDEGNSMAALRLMETIGSHWSGKILDVRGGFAEVDVAEISRLFHNWILTADFNVVKAFNRLISHDWFERVWVVQEAAAPVRTKTVRCGDFTTDWWNLLASVSYVLYAVNQPSLRARLADPEPLHHQRMRGIFNLYSLQEKIKTKKLRTTLLETLASYRYFKASDPRDKVYALLGLVTEGTGQVAPDYTLSIADVYTSVAAHCIVRQHSLACLGYCHHTSRGSDLPSWVPDWRNPSPRHPFATLSRHRSDSFYFSTAAAHDHPPAQRVYSAGQPPPSFFSLPSSSRPPFPPPRVTPDGTTLVIPGFRLDTLAAVGAPFDPARDPTGAALRTWSPTSSPSLSSLAPPDATATYPTTGESLPAALGRTVVADVAKRGRVRARGFGVDWEYWISLTSDPVTTTDNNNNSSREGGSEPYSFAYPPPSPARRAEWGSLMFASAGRGVARTAASGLLCLVPGEAAVGDVVCVFVGGDVLYLLRERERVVTAAGSVAAAEAGGGDGGEGEGEKGEGRVYELVGECYVHGMMDEEAFAMLADGRARVEELRIA